MGYQWSMEAMKSLQAGRDAPEARRFWGILHPVSHPLALPHSISPTRGCYPGGSQRVSQQVAHSLASAFTFPHPPPRSLLHLPTPISCSPSFCPPFPSLSGGKKREATESSSARGHWSDEAYPRSELCGGVFVVAFFVLSPTVRMPRSVQRFAMCY